MPDIVFDMRGAIFVVTFNRPERGNIFNGAMAKILCDKFKSISEDRSIRAVLLRGNGDHFMNGHDLTGYAGDMLAIQDLIFQKVHMFYAVIRDMQVMEKPVISAVHGRVSGAGFNFMLASDLVIASRGTVFNAGFTSHAMVPDGGATFFLPRKVGAARANEILLLNEDISAETAEKWGLINRVADDADFQEQAFAWAEKLASGATRALGAAKRLIAKSFEQDLNAQLALETAYWTTGSKTFDYREAIKAFTEKRVAKFTGT